MDTRFWKTALGDDAKMYQASKDAVTKEELKNLSGRQKLAYFRDYYLKICLAVIACAVIAIYIIYTSVISPSRQVLSVAFLNGCSIEDTEGLSSLLEDKLGMERKKDYVSAEHFNLENYQMNMAFVTRLGAGSVDLVICPRGDFDEQAQKGMFADLREYLPQETYESLADRIIDGRAAEMDDQGNVLSYGEDTPFGIDLSDSALCAEYVESSDTPVLCISATPTNVENALKAIGYFTGQQAK